MISEFEVEENTFEQPKIKTAKGRGCFFKKYYVTLLSSILIHFLLVLLLFFTAEKQQPKQVGIIPKAIKSYLYHTPAKLEKVNSIVTPQASDILAIKKKVKKEPIKEEKSEITKIESFSNARAIKKHKSSKVPSLPKPKVPKKVVKPSFSSYQQLEDLRQAINREIIEQGVIDLQQFRSPSVMHGDQTLVPHSTKRLTPEQKKERKTTIMSDNISITKYDSGICTIERKRFSGSPVEGSLAAFSCGESKFDKSFREHMKKVGEKLIPVISNARNK